MSDPVTDFIEEKGLPKSRETYLFLLFGGEVPDTLDAEIEASLPDFAKEAESDEPDIRRVNKN